MGGVTAARRVSCVLGALAVTATLLAGAPNATAVEAFDGRIQIHGYGEVQMRYLSRNFNDNIDLSQWANILHIEIETDIAPDGFGPFSAISSYVGLEVRYDCVWTRACGLSQNANLYGDRAVKMPQRLGDARKTGYSGLAFLGDTRQRLGIPFDVNGTAYGLPPLDTGNFARRTGKVWNVDGLDGLFGIAGPDGNIETTNDNPAWYVFQSILGYGFGMRHTKGISGAGTQTLGPWHPSDSIIANGALRDIANPFNPLDTNPILLAAFSPGGSLDTADLSGCGGTPASCARGSLALPFRPAPAFAAGTKGNSQANGLWYPSQALVQQLQKGRIGEFDQNFSQNELAWNHGASQEQWRELKEAYLDLEMLDGRFFARLGKQNIVWGKTELFRTTDQFNPQDLGLSSLPSLEESRVALWAARFIYSFYDVGPLNDVRLEAAVNLDHVEPADLGKCGEPYSPNPVCDKTMGLFAHGLTGQALIGERRPQDWYHSPKGLDYGARLEFRWDRFSFALTDFYGYNDFPYLQRVNTYSRNVDPTTGRPRETTSTGSCVTGNEPACLTPQEAVTKHSINQTYFALICASSVSFSSLDRAACGQTVFNSQTPVPPLGPIAGILGNVLAGSALGGTAYRIQAFGTPVPSQSLNPLVALNADPSDGGGGALSSRLTDQQEALLGCGPFYQTNCDSQGIDLMNAEASVLLQSWPGIDGVYPNPNQPNLRTLVAPPGTVGFNGAPVATRYQNGVLYRLPGSRGPGDPGYDPNVDGSVQGKAIPNLVAALAQVPGQAPGFAAATGKVFKNEMAIVSWNLLMLTVGLSAPTDPANPKVTEFDKARPFRTDGCSYAVPYLCGSTSALFTVSGTQRNTVKAGGNGRFGRRDFNWASGGEGLLKYKKRNVLGFSADFAEDVTKTNWSIETTWFGDQPYADNDQFDGLSNAQQFNLTTSVDRPTFINFLNLNRTFFFNSQWFFQYLKGYNQGMTVNGPWNVLFTFTVQTGYFQDRLLPGITSVYDFMSDSGALLPSINYRFSERFSTEFGMAFFWGRFQSKAFPLNPITSSGNQIGRYGYSSYVENGLAAVKDRDEVYLRIRYTF